MDKRDPNRVFGFLMTDITRLMRRDFARRAQPLDMTEGQWRVLARLSGNQGLSQAALAELMDVQPITLVRLIDRLEAAGLVERRPAPKDRRAFQLYLTPKAQPIIDRIWDFAHQTREEAMAGLSPAAREQLIDTLIRIKANLARNNAGDVAETPDAANG
ncbi:MAG TPA: MarR family transcriptional regulator [Alphaproteobacteria bacterium]